MLKPIGCSLQNEFVKKLVSYQKYISLKRLRDVSLQNNLEIERLFPLSTYAQYTVSTQQRLIITIHGVPTY